MTSATQRRAKTLKPRASSAGIFFIILTPGKEVGVDCAIRCLRRIGESRHSVNTKSVCLRQGCFEQSCQTEIVDCQVVPVSSQRESTANGCNRTLSRNYR